MPRKGVIPIPPAINTATLADFLCNVKEPVGESIFTCVPRGTFFSETLNAVSRMRVANIRWLSKGEVARLVDVFARRMQVQERLTTQIAETIESAHQATGRGSGH